MSPEEERRMLLDLMSLCIKLFEWRKESACRHSLQTNAMKGSGRGDLLLHISVKVPPSMYFFWIKWIQKQFEFDFEEFCSHFVSFENSPPWKPTKKPLEVHSKRHKGKQCFYVKKFCGLQVLPRFPSSFLLSLASLSMPLSSSYSCHMHSKQLHSLWIETMEQSKKWMSIEMNLERKWWNFTLLPIFYSQKIFWLGLLVWWAWNTLFSKQEQENENK